MKLNFEDHRQHLQQMIEAALAAADPAQAVRRHLQRQGSYLIVGPYRYQLGQGRIYLIAVGKAGLTMGKAALEVLQGEITAGIIIIKQTEAGRPRRYDANVGTGQAQVTVYEAGHPIADEGSLQATAHVMELMRETRKGDLVLCLISGGTSALLTQPYLNLPQWQHLTQVLLESGCTINELNTVRKHLDRVKGGGLAQMAAPAATISLILSDVVSNHLDTIGSGPTAPNPESPAEALSVLHRYNVARELAPETWTRITERLTNPRTPTSLARFAELEVKNVIVGDVRTAAEAAVNEARAIGFEARLLTAQLEGEAREVGRVGAALAKDATPGQCLILGGETTVTVRGDGKGGRNQELALAAGIGMAGSEYRVVCSFATDGDDGMTDAAGAVVTGQTVPQARTIGLNPLECLDCNDSYGFFTQLGEKTGRTFLLFTGPTGTNVNDLLFIMAYPPA